MLHLTGVHFHVLPSRCRHSAGWDSANKKLFKKKNIEHRKKHCWANGVEFSFKFMVHLFQVNVALKTHATP